MSNERIVLCEACGSEGRILTSNGGPDDTDHGPCPHCEGTGSEVIETQPVELEDYECENCLGMPEHGCYCQAVGAVGPGGPLLEQDRETKAREECARLGIDPDDICADGGVTAWLVVDQELRAGIQRSHKGNAE